MNLLTPSKLNQILELRNLHGMDGFIRRNTGNEKKKVLGNKAWHAPLIIFELFFCKKNTS